jgi:dephospho-CoA kinase
MANESGNLQSKRPVIGLIGGIGSGKSQVAAVFAQRGARVVSGDQFGHEALRQRDLRARVVQRWGPEVLDEHGEIDRRKLGAQVFADPAQRRELEALVFPWIERRIREEIARAQADPKVTLVVLDAAVMLEAGWNSVCDWLVYVHAPRDVRLRRLAEKRGWSAKEVEARENVQMSLTDKANRADFAVDNSGTLEHLASQIDALLRRWGLLEGETRAHRLTPDT